MAIQKCLGRIISKPPESASLSASDQRIVTEMLFMSAPTLIETAQFAFWNEETFES
jgi:hypothetical protein